MPSAPSPRRSGLNNKSPEDLKKIVQTYVENVVVYQDYADITLIVHTNGGGEACVYIPLSVELAALYASQHKA